MEDKVKKQIENIDNVISKLPDDIMMFLKELDDFSDPYNHDYIGIKMSNKLDAILKKYS